MQKPSVKVLSFLIILLWEVIYAHFYNWDSPLDWVPVMYDLIDWSLKLHSSLRIILHLILTHNTQDFWFNECLFHLCDCACSNVMCVCSAICGSNQKDFCSFCLFWEVICITHVFQSFSSCFCVKNMFSGCFCDLFHV